MYRQLADKNTSLFTFAQSNPKLIPGHTTTASSDQNRSKVASNHRMSARDPQRSALFS